MPSVEAWKTRREVIMTETFLKDNQKRLGDELELSRRELSTIPKCQAWTVVRR